MIAMSMMRRMKMRRINSSRTRRQMILTRKIVRRRNDTDGRYD